MATYHIRSIGTFGEDVYYVNENHWTDDFDSRKTWTNRTTATTAKNKQTVINGVTYRTVKSVNSTVVTE